MKLFWRVGFLGLITCGVFASEGSAGEPRALELTVDGRPRTALVYAPPKPEPAKPLPLVFVWHGHGGNSRNALHTFQLDRLWPAAISVYPQGLPTPGKLTDPDGKLPGWQSAPDGQDDRDLHFFDALLARMKADYPVDPKQIYCTGHSNGAGFTFLLWRTRPDVFAAFAPCSGAANYARELTPKPALLLGGRRDPLVKFEWQERMAEVVRGINGCDADGHPWEGVGTLYPSKTATPVVTYFYDGGHMTVPEEMPLIVKFFQQHAGK